MSSPQKVNSKYSFIIILKNDSIQNEISPAYGALTVEDKPDWSKSVN